MCTVFVKFGLEITVTTKNFGRQWKSINFVNKSSSKNGFWHSLWGKNMQGRERLTIVSANLWWL